MADNSELTERQQKLYEQRPQLYRPGQSGNPNGRPEGTISLKTAIKQYWAKHPDKLAEVVDRLATDPKFHALTWQMLEGAPSQKVDNNLKQDIHIEISAEVAKRNKLKQITEQKPNTPVTNNIVSHNIIEGEATTQPPTLLGTGQENKDKGTPLIGGTPEAREVPSPPEFLSVKKITKKTLKRL